MSGSGLFSTKSARRPHLINRTGGLAAEVGDLRNDINDELGHLAAYTIDEWLAPLAADNDFVLTTTPATSAVQVITTLSTVPLTQHVIPHARNLTVGCTVTGTGEGHVTVAGYDINGNDISEDFTVPASTASVTGTKCFKTVTSVTIPALTAGMTVLSVVVGTGVLLGLGRPVMQRNALPSTLVELYNGGVVGGSIAASTAVNQAATATESSLKLAGHVRIPKAIVAELISIVADVGIADGAQIIAAQPDVARKLQLHITDGNSSITAGSVVFVGVGVDGSAVTETIDISNGGSHTYVTTYAYSTITSITVGGLTGAAAADHISVGVATALALPVPAGSTNLVVHSAFVGDTAEAVGTVDTTAMTIVPTSLPDAARIYDFNFSYTLTATQNAHTHVQNAHSHGAGATAGTVTAAAVNLPNGAYSPGNAPNAARNYALVYEFDPTV